MTAYDPAAEALRARFRREEAALRAEGYLTIDDAAELLGVHRGTISRMIRDGRLHATHWEDRTVTRPEWIAEVPRSRRLVPTGMLTAAEAAELVGVHPLTVRRAIRAGHLPATTKSGGYVIAPADLDVWAPRRNPAVAWRRANGWLSVAEAAALLAISRPALNIRIQQGRQSAVRAGADAPIPGAWLIRAEDVGRRAA